MKKIIIILIAFVTIICCTAFPFIKSGYDMYRNAINVVPLEEKVEEIRNKDNYAKISEIPQTYINAVIAVEDHRYYIHNGIDIIAICRAAFNDIKSMSLVEGGSTITQQLCKNIYFTQEKKLERKIAEVFMAWKMERTLDKDEILELYFNTSYFGNGYYTIKEASLGYFDKLPKDLSDSECIMLAGIPNAPSVYALNVNPKLAKERQIQVVKKMLQYGYISKEDANKIINEK